MNKQPIGIFDSGVGGLSVMREIIKLLPYEDLIYYADSANCPYGTRPPEEIRVLAVKVAAFLLEQGAKALVVACNTASTAAVAHLRQRWPGVPIVGMVPAVKPAAAMTQTGVIGVLATEATGRAPVLLDIIDRFATDTKVLIVAPPGLVERIEAGQISHPETTALLRQYLDPMLAEGADALVLGCTHFPFLRPTLQKIAGERLSLIDSGEAVARQTRRLLEQAQLLNPQTLPGQITFYTSTDPIQLAPVIARLLGYTSIPLVLQNCG
ncbi:MAG: glutamate racemase [Chloroflexota bacterium]|nr:glutamate racemase [Chloroflexota bacterium]